MRDEKEIKGQVSAVRERVKELSGFYIGEAAAMVYVLEWVLGKRETSPAGELGRAGGESETIAGNLTKLVEKATSAHAQKKSRPAPSLPRRIRE
jgi:phage-related minor tail protein